MYAERRACCQHQQYLARSGARARGNENHRGYISAAENRPSQRMPERRAPAGCRHRPVPTLPCFAPLPHQAPANACDAHFLARRRSGRRGEQVARQAVDRSAALLGGTLHTRAPRGGEHRGQREDSQQRQRRVYGCQQGQGHAEPQDPAAGREQRHVHVVQHEDLVTQHG